MDIKKIFIELADELDRHYISPERPQILLLEPKDYQEVETAIEELMENSIAYKTNGSYGAGTIQPQSEERLHIAIGGYSWNIMTSGKSSLIWKGLKG